MKDAGETRTDRRREKPAQALLPASWCPPAQLSAPMDHLLGRLRAEVLGNLLPMKPGLGRGGWGPQTAPDLHLMRGGQQRRGPRWGGVQGSPGAEGRRAEEYQVGGGPFQGDPQSLSRALDEAGRSEPLGLLRASGTGLSLSAGLVLHQPSWEALQVSRGPKPGGPDWAEGPCSPKPWAAHGRGGWNRVSPKETLGLAGLGGRGWRQSEAIHLLPGVEPVCRR